MARKKKTEPDIGALIAATLSEILQLNSEGDPSEVGTGFQLAGLNARVWSLKVLKASNELQAHEATPKAQRKGDYDKVRFRLEDAITDADKRHHEWETQRARLASAIKADMLPKVLAMLEDRESRANRLAGLE